MRSFSAFGSEIQEFWNRLDVPVGVLWLCVSQICAQLDHFAIRVEALPIPLHDRAHGEGMPQIVNAWTGAVLIER